MDTGRPVDTMDTLDDSNKLNIVSRASLVALLNWKMWQFLASPKNSRLAMLWNKLVFTWKAFECVLIAYSRLHFLVCLHTCQQCSLLDKMHQATMRNICNKVILKNMWYYIIRTFICPVELCTPPVNKFLFLVCRKAASICNCVHKVYLMRAGTPKFQLNFISHFHIVSV